MKIKQDATLSSVCVLAILVAGHYFITKKERRKNAEWIYWATLSSYLIVILAAIIRFL